MGRHKLSRPWLSKLPKQKESDETLCLCLHFSLNKFPSGQTRWCILANPKVLTPITYGREMRHTVPLYCYKSFFVDGWQLFIRSNLFKPPLRELTFSTLTRFAVYGSHSWFTLGGGTLASSSFSHRLSIVQHGWNGGGKIGRSMKKTRSESIFSTLYFLFKSAPPQSSWFVKLLCGTQYILIYLIASFPIYNCCMEGS